MAVCPMMKQMGARGGAGVERTFRPPTCSHWSRATKAYRPRVHCRRRERSRRVDALAQIATTHTPSWRMPAAPSPPTTRSRSPTGCTVEEPVAASARAAARTRAFRRTADLLLGARSAPQAAGRGRPPCPPARRAGRATSASRVRPAASKNLEDVTREGPKTRALTRAFDGQSPERGHRSDCSLQIAIHGTRSPRRSEKRARSLRGTEKHSCRDGPKRQRQPAEHIDIRNRMVAVGRSEALLLLCSADQLRPAAGPYQGGSSFSATVAPVKAVRSSLSATLR